VHTTQPWPTPGFAKEGDLYPAYHVLRGLARLGGKPLRALDLAVDSPVQGLAVRADAGTELWLANLSGSERQVQLAVPAVSAFVLDGSCFEDACRIVELADGVTPPADPHVLSLTAYAVARVLLR